MQGSGWTKEAGPIAAPTRRQLATASPHLPELRHAPWWQRYAERLGTPSASTLIFDGIAFDANLEWLYLNGPINRHHDGVLATVQFQSL